MLELNDQLLGKNWQKYKDIVCNLMCKKKIVYMKYDEIN